MKTYIRIPVEGDPSRMEVPDGSNELSLLQACVGGYIEPVDVGDHTIYVNEEGLLIDNLEPNFTAMSIARHPLLVGDAVMVGPVDSEGETESVSPEWIARLVPDGTHDSMGAGDPDPSELGHHPD